MTASGLGAASFLTGRDDLPRLRSAGDSLTLATLFPASAQIISQFVHLPFVHGDIEPIAVSTGFITLQPDQAVTLMFDVAVYSRGEGRVDFGHTLKPAANLFTDPSGNPVLEVIAVGTSAAAAAPAAALTLTPATATTTVGTLATLNALATTATGAPAADTEVTFAITSGPMAGLMETVVTDSDGVATLSYGSTASGTDRIVATAGALQSEEVEQTWQAACASNVSPQVTVTRGGYRLNRATNTFSQTVTVANAGAALAGAVLNAGVAGIADE